MIDKRVGISATGGKTYPFELGYVCIPPDVDREAFVKHCLTTGTISVQPTVNSALHRVRCDALILQRIEFPEKSTEFGSIVGYCRNAKTKEPFVNSIYLDIDDYNDLEEHQARISRTAEGKGTATVQVDGKGSALISVSSEKKNKGSLEINVSNSTDTAKLNQSVKGTTKNYSSKRYDVESNEEIKLKTVEGEEESSITIDKETIKHNAGSEPMLLGQTTIDLLQEFIQLVSTSVIMGQPLSNSVQIQELATKLNDLLSERSFLD